MRRDYVAERLCDVCLTHLFKVALNKDESEETRKEVEMALLALSNVNPCDKLNKELYLSSITEIIKYYQQSSKLTRLAYQSAWNFLINRYQYERGLEEVVLNELNFVKEAEKELEELQRCVDWEKDESELREMEEVRVMQRWCKLVTDYIEMDSFNEETTCSLVACLVRLCRTAGDNRKNAGWLFLFPFQQILERNRNLLDVLLKEGAVDLMMEKMLQQTLKSEQIKYCTDFLCELIKIFNARNKARSSSSKWNGVKAFVRTLLGELSERKRIQNEKEIFFAKRKAIFGKLEENGYEDIVHSYCSILSDKDLFSNLCFSLCL
ncbi:uncharacterized protein MONOS_18253 [Monocercomonoides exilis]|uniref:uncharacterized protein n=1 Tax=Monocercomonoides exilis TaxID=2049356 RepID=UPI00355AB663|nr:hypothetical protein MONOS_18253 [Monocercomonoides exilis]